MDSAAAGLIGMGCAAAGFAGAGVGIGYIFGKVIEVVARQPELHAVLLAGAGEHLVRDGEFAGPVAAATAATGSKLDRSTRIGPGDERGGPAGPPRFVFRVRKPAPGFEAGAKAVDGRLRRAC